MRNSWYLIEEFFRSFHQWPKLVLFFIVGCLIGWGASYVWPWPQRATFDIYVALNPYRAFEDKNFIALARPKYSNLDDYKNWQMSQLKAVIFLDEMLQDTLARLRQENKGWETVNRAELQDMLSTEWRSAGKWSLVAESGDAKRATQAVQAWGQVVLERTDQALQSARQAIFTDEEIQRVIEEQRQAQADQGELTATQAALQSWLAEGGELARLPQDQPLQALKRWELIALATRLANFTPAWLAVLQQQPPATAFPTAYLDWTTQVDVRISDELTGLESRVKELDADRSRLEAQYSEQFDRSLGLSPNLEIKKLDSDSTGTVRPTGLLVLVGGALGFLGWVYLELARITQMEASAPRSGI